jgi:RNA polymerase sigma factor (sigma-70 family)
MLAAGLIHMSFPFWLGGPSRDDDAAAPRGGLRHTPHAWREACNRDDDHTLVARVRAGDREAFTELYTRHLQLLVAFAYGYVHSEEIAQDIVADLFLHLWITRTEWNPQHGVRAYLLTAVRHRALNSRRNSARARTVLALAARSTTPVAASQAPYPTDIAIEAEQRRAEVRRAIDQLSPDRRRALLLRWRFGLTSVEIASALGIPRAAVDQLISRGVKMLRTLVRE